MRALLRRFALAIGLALASLPAAAQTRGGAPVATIDVLDIGQGDAILIRSPEGRTALIDAGPSKAVVKAIQDRGVSKIDLVLVTHHHTDHFGGMAEVIRVFKPRYFVATNSNHGASTYLRLLEQVKRSGMVVVAPTAKRRNIELGSVILTMLPQPPLNDDEENDNSIGVRLVHGDLSMLMTGDSEPGSRRFWIDRCPELIRDCDILKLAHHGSHNGTDRDWLDLVRPELAVASLATGNSYGHPHRETLDLLKSDRIPLLRTDVNGTITIRSDGRTWQVDRGSGDALAAGSSEAPKAAAADRTTTRVSSRTSAPSKAPSQAWGRSRSPIAEPEPETVRR